MHKWSYICAPNLLHIFMYKASHNIKVLFFWIIKAIQLSVEYLFQETAKRHFNNTQE